MVTDNRRRQVAVLVFAFEAVLAGCGDAAWGQMLPPNYAPPQPPGFTNSSNTSPQSSGLTNYSTAPAQTSAGSQRPAVLYDGWLVQPSLIGSETYSDNISLGSSGHQRGDFVTAIQPSLMLDRHSPSLLAHIDYAPEALLYAGGTTADTIRNFLDATATATLVKDLLYFDALGEISQQSILPIGNQQANSVTSSANTAETRVFGFGPYLHSRLGEDGSYTLGYRVTHSDSNNNALARNTLNDVYGKTDSATPIEALRFGLDYDRSQENYVGLANTRLSHVTGVFSYSFDPWITVRAGAGYDSDSYPTVTPQTLSGSIYLAGFDWKPSPTTSLSVDAAHHYYGPTANIQFLHRTLWTAWTLGYSENRTSTTRLLSAPATSQNFTLINDFFTSQFPDPTERAIATRNFLQQAILPSAQFNDIGFLANEYFLQKALNASVAFVGAKNTVTLFADRTVQEAISNQLIPTNVFTPFQNYRGRGFEVSWNHRLNEETSTTLYAQQIHNVLISTPGEFTQLTFSGSLQRNFTPDFSGIVTLRSTREHSTIGNDFVEDELIASIRMLF